MKQFYCLVIALFTISFSFAAPVIKATGSSSDWNDKDTWNKKRTPAAGDTIVIPAGKLVKINDWIALNNVQIDVQGTLQFEGILNFFDLGNASSILVQPGGKIVNYGLWNFLGLDGKTLNVTSIVGPQMLSAATSYVFSGFNVLPVKFEGFSAAANGSDVVLQWATSEEQNARAYEVQRSFDGTNWNVIATVAAAGNTAALTNYSYTDKGNSKPAYYRIRQVDSDGKYVYTDVKFAKPAGSYAADVNIAAAPGALILQFKQQVKSSVTVRFVNMNGTVITEQKLNRPVGQVVVNTPLKGNYVVALSNGQDMNVARRVIF